MEGGIVAVVSKWPNRNVLLDEARENTRRARERFDETQDLVHWKAWRVARDRLDTIEQNIAKSEKQ